MSNPNLKVCIVCLGEFVDSSSEYIVFIIDSNTFLGDGGEIEVVNMNPTIRFDWMSFHLPAFCVLGPKLYIIEGFHPEHNLDGRSVRTYDLSYQVSNLKVEKSTLSRTVAMNGVKVSPRAAVTHDGKILAFSSVIQLYPLNEYCCDFELFDPTNMTWDKLPNLPVSDYKGLHYFRIQSFAFMKKTIFFIRTEIGDFALDLKVKKLKWNRSPFNGAECIPSHVGDSCVVINRDVCVIPFRAFDIRVRGTNGNSGTKEDIFATLIYTFPDRSSFSKGYSDQSSCVTLLSHSPDEATKEEFSVCFLLAGVHNETKHPELLLEIYTCHDLLKCKKKLSEFRKKKVKENSIWWKRKVENIELPYTLKVKSFKIVVNARQSRWFHLCSFSSVVI